MDPEKTEQPISLEPVENIMKRQTERTMIEIKVKNFERSSFEFQKRRHPDWNTNYQLYRDKVITNRLTQRQSVNVPLMKETIKTALSTIDEAPDISFEEKGNDEAKEILINEFWKYTYDKCSLEIKDIVDKKQVCLYGRSFKKINIKNGEFYVEILDPMDVLVDRYVDPADIDTANYICHYHIYKTLGAITSNKHYDKAAIDRLKVYFSTPGGLKESHENAEALQAKRQKMQDMNLVDIEDIHAGEVIVELKEHYIKITDGDTGEEKIYLAVESNNGEFLMVKPLEEVLGVNFFPIESWADDVERTDVWSDGLGDIVRTPNIIANTWISQLVENRTLRNFGMNYFNSTNKEFIPQTYEPKPWGWYPVPGDPNKMVKRVDVDELKESLPELEWVINMGGRASAVTGTQKGDADKAGITLGEIQLMNQKATKRLTSMSKFYRNSWKRFAYKWYKLMEANNNLLSHKLSKKGRNNKYFSKWVNPADFKSENGYRVIVTSSAEQEEKTLETLQRFDVVIQKMPNNKPLKMIHKKKLLDLIGVTPEEKDEIIQFEEREEDAATPQVEPSKKLISLPELNKDNLVPANANI